jgi:DNA-binding transcriptional ArsR family regulator
VLASAGQWAKLPTIKNCRSNVLVRGKTSQDAGEDHVALSGTPLDINALNVSARRASVLLRAMGNLHRLRILCQLLATESSVGELERIVGLSQSALSQHLARLRRDSLVKTRRSAQTIFYSLAGSEVETVLASLCDLYCCEHAPAREIRSSASGMLEQHDEMLVPRVAGG